MMKIGTWSAAFTITVGSLQIDFTELSQQGQIDILCALAHGITDGEIVEQEKTECVRAVS